jgi:hypothetical protein
VEDRSALRALASERLGGVDPCAWVQQQQREWAAKYRPSGNPNDPGRLGWRRLAAMLSDEIGHRVAANTLRLWCRQVEDDESR